MSSEYKKSEIHFLLQCPVFHDLRDDLTNNPTFIRLLSCDEPDIIQCLSLFVPRAFNRRQEYLYENIVEKLLKCPLYISHCYCFERAYQIKITTK